MQKLHGNEMQAKIFEERLRNLATEKPEGYELAMQVLAGVGDRLGFEFFGLDPEDRQDEITVGLR